MEAFIFDSADMILLTAKSYLEAFIFIPIIPLWFYLPIKWSLLRRDTVEVGWCLNPSNFKLLFFISTKMVFALVPILFLDVHEIPLVMPQLNEYINSYIMVRSKIKWAHDLLFQQIGSDFPPLMQTIVWYKQL